MRTGIRGQFLAFSFVAILFTGVSISWYSLHDGWRFNSARIEDDIHNIAKFVAVDVTDDLYFRNLAGLRRTMEQIKTYRQIEDAQLLVWEGEEQVAVATTADKRIKISPGLIKLAFTEKRWVSQRSDDRIEGVIPIVMRNGPQLGMLHMVASMKTPLAAMKQRAIHSLVITAICILLAAGLVWGFTRKLLQDIQVIAKAAQALGVGDFTARVALARQDEIGALGGAINRMAQAMRDNEEARVRATLQLTQLTSDLEAQVSARTADVTARNEQLAGEIARREQIEENLRRIDARHRAVVEIAPDAVVTTDAVGNIVEFNKVAEITFGYNRQDVLGKAMADVLIPAEFRAGYQAGISLIARGHDALRGKRVEIVAMRADGAQFPVEFATVSFDTPDGYLLTAFMRDISERKQHEKALHDAEQKLRELVETAQAIIWETDALTWKYSFVSQGAEAILGYPLQRWLTEPHFWPMIIHDDDRAMVLKTSRENTRAGLDHELEYRALSADGRVVWLKDIVRAIKNSEGKVTGLRGIKIEITSRKQVEESLRESFSGMLFVQRISRALLVGDNIAIALDEILRECVARGDFDLGTILLLSDDGASAKVLASYGYRAGQNIPRGGRMDSGDSDRYRSVSLQGPYVQENIQSGGRLRRLQREGVESVLLVPIGTAERNIGLFQLATRSKTPIDRRLIPLMETIGQQIGMTIEKARLLEKTQINFERTAALHEINLAASSTLNLNEMLDLLLDKVVHFLPFTSVIAVRLLNRETGQLDLAVCRGITEIELRAESAAGKKQLSEMVIERRDALAIADLSDHADCPNPEFYRERGLVSALGVPLMNQYQMLGTLLLITREKREFAADEIDFVKLLAGQTTMAIQNASLYGDLQKQTSQLAIAHQVEARSRADSELLASISHEILAAGEQDTWLETVLGKISQATDFDLATILRLENDGLTRRAVASYGYRITFGGLRQAGPVSPSGETRPAALEYDAPIVWSELQKGERLRTLRDEGAQMALSLPIKWSDRPMGILQLASRMKKTVEPREIELFEAIAKQIAIGLQKSDLLQTTRQDLLRREILHEVNLAVTSSLEIANVGEKLVQTIAQKLPYALSSAIWLLNPESGALELIAGRNLSGQAPALYQALLQRVVDERAALAIGDLWHDPRVPPHAEAGQLSARSFVGVPLIVNDQCLGAFSFAAGAPRDFSRDELHLFTLIAGQAAVGIQNAQHYRDLREQKAAIERAKEIEAAAAAKSRFLAMMSHEIRTPLNAVIGLTDLLLKSCLNDDQRKLAGTIQQSGSGLLKIINDILDFSKIEADKIAVELVQFNLREIVTGAVTIMSFQAQSKGLRLELQYDQAVPSVINGDGGRIRQILLNLLGNAIKFTDHGVVTLGVEIEAENSDGLQIKFSVTDEGIGISAQAQARLFQPFTQADTSTTRRYGGTGLGLVISKRLADLMGGGLHVRSEEGRGSTFWFTVFAPRATHPVEDAEVGPNHETANDQASLPKHARILLVEDNPVNQLIASRLLELLGLRADIANDGVEAVAALERQSYDLLLMDCEMPNMDGYQATAAIRLREADTGMRTRIIAMTANAMSGDRERCLAAGMDDYLAKPIQLETLQATLERCL